MSVGLSLPLWVQGLLSLGPAGVAELPSISVRKRISNPQKRLEALVGRCTGGPIIPFSLDDFDANLAVHLVEAVINSRGAIAAIYSEASMADVGWLEFGHGVNRWHDRYEIPGPKVLLWLKPWLRSEVQAQMVQFPDHLARLRFDADDSLKWTIRTRVSVRPVGPSNAKRSATVKLYEQGKERILRGFGATLTPLKQGIKFELETKVPETILQISALADRGAWLGVEYENFSALFPLKSLEPIAESEDVWVPGIHPDDRYLRCPREVSVELDESQLAAVSVHRRWLLGELNLRFVTALKAEWESLKR